MATVSKLTRKEHLGNPAAECWSIKGLECWSNKALECWSIGLPASLREALGAGVLECCIGAFRRDAGLSKFIGFGQRLRLIACLIALIVPPAAHAWGNGAWAVRKKITVDTSTTGVAINQPIEPAVVLLRFHNATFQFPSANPAPHHLRFSPSH